MYYVYMLRCVDESLYTGITNDVERRMHRHNAGKASKYTRTRLPLHLVYLEPWETKSEALKRELQIKKMSKPKKEKMVHDYLTKQDGAIRTET